MGSTVQGSTEGGAADRSVPRSKLSAMLHDLAAMPEIEQSEFEALVLGPGSVLERFLILRELGRGGFGVVYEAMDRDLRRRVALKVIRPRGRLRTRVEDWLVREAEAAAQLAHPNIAALHDAARSRAGPYLVFELLEGETLQHRMERGPVGVREAVHVAVCVSRALAHAHRAGVVHCDLKPSNIFLQADGGVKVLDFGLARVFGETGLRSGGTPAYMAPEQWRGEREDPRTDVFALGVVVYEMLRGELPFVMDGDRSSVLDPGRAPALAVRGAPRTLGRFVAATLEKDREARPNNGQEALERLLQAERRLSSRRIWTPIRAVLALAALIVAAAVTAVAFRMVPSVPPQRITVALADVANDAGDPDLDAVSALLATSLEQSRSITVLTRGRMLEILRQLGKRDIVRIDEALAREVARHVGARGLILPSAQRFDDVYAIQLKAVDPVTDESMFALDERVRGKASVLRAVDRLSERTRRELRESAEDVTRSSVEVADAISGSLEAYRHYFRGRDLFHRQRFGEALDAFRQAWRLDPTFAMAAYEVAFVGVYVNSPQDERQAATRAALRHADRAPEKEQLFIRAWAARVSGNEDEALALYREVAKAFPDDKLVYFLAGDLLMHRDQIESAMTWFLQMEALDPGWSGPCPHIVSGLAQLGRHEEALAIKRRAVQLVPGAESRYRYAEALAWNGRREEAVDEMRRAVQAGPGMQARLPRFLVFAGHVHEAETEARAHPNELAIALAYQGRYRDAIATVEGVRQRDVPFHAATAAYRAALGERQPTTESAMRLAESLPRYAPVALLMTSIVALAEVGALDELERVAAKLPSGTHSEQLVRAIVAWKRGERPHALASLRALAAERWGFASYYHGAVAAEMGLDDEAVAAFQRFEKAFLVSPEHSWMHARAVYLRALCNERLAQREQAREAVEHLLGLWRRADPDLPLLADVRALAGRIGVGHAASRR